MFHLEWNKKEAHMQYRNLLCLMSVCATLFFIIYAFLPAEAQDLPEFQKVPITLKASEQFPKNVLTNTALTPTRAMNRFRIN